MTYKKRDLERLAQEQTQDYLRRSSITYLECCISLMLSHMPAENVAEVLEAEARFIRDLG